MAITYTSSLSETLWSFSDNNLIASFTSDSIKTPLFCTIEIPDIDDIVIYPLPDESFWFNFSQYLTTLINNYDDDLDLSSIDSADIDTFVFDWSRVFWSDDITITITFDDDSTDTDTITPLILLGYEQLRAYKKGQTVTGLSQTILSPLKENTANRFYLKYWSGYPFDFALTKNIPSADTTQTITNNTNAITSPDIELPNDVNRVFLSDGDTSITLEDYLPLTDGYNELEFQEDNVGALFIDLWKQTGSCGVYLKWLNQYGGYNYWLFNEQHEETLKHKEKGMINNNFFNLGNTVSPMKSLGRELENSITVIAELLKPDDVNVLKGLFNSNKIYLFTGERFTRNSFNDWIEVNISGGNNLIRDFKGNVPDVSVTIELPKQYSISL